MKKTKKKIGRPTRKNIGKIEPPTPRHDSSKHQWIGLAIVIMAILVVFFSIVSGRIKTSGEAASVESSRKWILCNDSDRGIFSEVKGNVTAVYAQGVVRRTIAYLDVCQNSTHVIERFCRENVPRSIFLTCAHGCLDGACAPESVAYFEFTDGNDNFIIKLTDPELITEARDILAGRETRRTHVMGTIVKAKASYNPRWSYYLEPSSIAFFSSAIEVCDAQISYVQKNLKSVGGSFLPDNTWCPWSSVLIEEVVKKDSTEAGIAQQNCSNIKVDCTALYQPVCGVDGKTYGNECELKRACVVKAYDGSCDYVAKHRPNILGEYCQGNITTMTAGETRSISFCNTVITIEVVGVNTQTEQAYAVLSVDNKTRRYVKGESYLFDKIRIEATEIGAYTAPATSGYVKLVPGVFKLNHTILEGESYALVLNATDPDNDTITFYYGKPLDEFGHWQPSYDDAGIYTIQIIANDGLFNTTENFTLFVEDVLSQK